MIGVVDQHFAGYLAMYLSSRLMKTLKTYKIITHKQLLIQNLIFLHHSTPKNILVFKF